MAKFNKDTFINYMSERVQSAIDKNLITKEDMESNNLERLHTFLQYELVEYIEDRKFALDVLKDFNYDEKTPWSDLQSREQFGTFQSLMDIALVNLWKFLDSEGITSYDRYDNTNYNSDKTLLDLAHDEEAKSNSEIPIKSGGYNPKSPEADNAPAPEFRRRIDRDEADKGLPFVRHGRNDDDFEA